jgi:predicted ester cyclase
MTRRIALASGALTLGYATSAMAANSEEVRNIAAIRGAFEDLNRGDIAAYVARFAEDALNFGRPVGRAGIEERVRDIFTTIPDVRFTVEDLVAAGDEVVTRNMFSGTHRGVGRHPLNGGMLVGVAPTGKSFSVQHIHWFKMRNGLIAAHTACRDDLGMMVQLGLLTRPSADR